MSKYVKRKTIFYDLKKDRQTSLGDTQNVSKYPEKVKSTLRCKPKNHAWNINFLSLVVLWENLLSLHVGNNLKKIVLSLVNVENLFRMCHCKMICKGKV